MMTRLPQFSEVARRSFFTTFLLLSTTGRSEIIGYDSFDYKGVTSNGADGGVFWDFKNTATTKHGQGVSRWADATGFAGISAASGGKLYTADSGMIRKFGGPSLAEESAGAVNGDTTAKRVYFKVNMVRDAAASWCGVSSFDFGSERLFFGLFPDGTGKFSIYDQTTFTRLALSTQNVNSDQNYVLVARLDFANDVISLYVDPNLNNAESFNTPVATALYTGTNWSTGLRLGSGGSGVACWDDLTVATTWENLRNYEVTSLADSGTGTLASAISSALPTGGRIAFAPQFGSVFAVTDTNRLLRFRRETPHVFDSSIPFTLPAGTVLSGMDFSEAGELYFLITTTPTKGGPVNDYENRLYKVNLTTGALTRQGGVGGFANFPEPSFDFDPITTAFRMVDSSGRTGSVTRFGTFTAGPDLINIRSGDEASVAHLGKSVGLPEGSSTLYRLEKIETELGTVTGAAKNEVSSLGPVGSGLTFDSAKFFDIADDDTALLVAKNGLPLGNPATKLFTLDLRTRRTVELGNIGGGSFNIVALCAAPTTVSSNFGYTINGGNSIIIDGHSTAPGITLRGTGRSNLLGISNNATVGLRNLNFTQGGGQYGGAIAHTDSISSAHTGYLSMDRCSLFKNTATLGGGLYVEYGGLRMRHCTLEANSCLGLSFDPSGGGIWLQSSGVPDRPMSLEHCTVTRNTVSVRGGGLYLNSGDINITNSIIAGNRSVGNGSRTGTSPDVHVQLLTGTSVPAPTVSFARCLLSDLEGSQIFDGPNGNRIFANTDRKIAALGSYGGPVRTAPPMITSPALEMAVGSVMNSDSRGFRPVGVPDSGAAEFQGKTDLQRWWDDDWDGDGMAYGVELLMAGEDPFVPGKVNLSIAPTATGYAVRFGGLNPAFFTYGRANLTRDPVVPFSGTQNVVRISSLSPLTTETLSGYTLLPQSGNRFDVLGTPTSPLGKRFYRLEAELLP